MAKKQPSTAQKRITWHTAFFDAIRLELEAYRQYLTFAFELPLNAEPLRIDALIIKEPGATIDKDLGRIFRRVNVVEYKNPDDTLTIQDFHKVAAYTRLYLSQHETPMTDITISFVISRYPRELFKGLTAFEYGIIEAYRGIYYITGEKHIPVQIVLVPELPEADNLWLRHLSNKLNREGMGKVIRAGWSKVKSSPIKAYLYQVFQANPEMLKELMIMERATVDQILEEIGWSAERRAEGKVEGRAEGRVEGRELMALTIAKKLIGRGWNAEEVAETAELDIDKVRLLYTE
jgi:hypothetical protein